MQLKHYQHIGDYQSATILEVSFYSNELLPIILQHCDHMQILVLDQWDSHRALFTTDQLMVIAARFPGLHTVIVKQKEDDKMKILVDYSAVKKAFPKLRITEFTAAIDFDILKVPIGVHIYL